MRQSYNLVSVCEDSELTLETGRTAVYDRLTLNDMSSVMGRSETTAGLEANAAS